MIVIITIIWTSCLIPFIALWGRGNWSSWRCGKQQAAHSCHNQPGTIAGICQHVNFLEGNKNKDKKQKHTQKKYTFPLPQSQWMRQKPKISSCELFKFKTFSAFIVFDNMNKGASHFRFSEKVGILSQRVGGWGVSQSQLSVKIFQSIIWYKVK